MKKTYTPDELLSLMRKEAGRITGNRLAIRLGMAQGYTHEVLTGKKPLSLNMAQAFAREFLAASTVTVERHFILAV